MSRVALLPPQVPVLATFPSPLVPDTGGGSGGTALSLSGEDKGGVVSPSRVRLREDMWICSRTYYVLDAEVRRDIDASKNCLLVTNVRMTFWCGKEHLSRCSCLVTDVRSAF